MAISLELTLGFFLCVQGANDGIEKTPRVFAVSRLFVGKHDPTVLRRRSIGLCYLKEIAQECRQVDRLVSNYENKLHDWCGEIRGVEGHPWWF